MLVYQSTCTPHVVAFIYCAAIQCSVFNISISDCIVYTPLFSLHHFPAEAYLHSILYWYLYYIVYSLCDKLMVYVHPRKFLLFERWPVSYHSVFKIRSKQEV